MAKETRASCQTQTGVGHTTPANNSGEVQAGSIGVSPTGATCGLHVNQPRVEERPIGEVQASQDRNKKGTRAKTNKTCHNYLHLHLQQKCRYTTHELLRY